MVKSALVVRIKETLAHKINASQTLPSNIEIPLGQRGAQAWTEARSDYAVLELFGYFFRGEKSKRETCCKQVPLQHLRNKPY